MPSSSIASASSFDRHADFPPGLDIPSSSPNEHTFPDQHIDGFYATTLKLKKLAKKFDVNLDDVSKEVKTEMQVAYARYVIELQHISVSLAVAENLSEEEVRSFSQTSILYSFGEC